MKLADVAQRSPQHVILFGDPKTGKSTLASQLAKKFKLIWLSLDNGHEILFKLAPEEQDKIELVVLPDTREWPIGWTTVNKVFDRQSMHICGRHGSNNCSVCMKGPEVLPGWTDIDPSKFDMDTIVVIDNGTQLGNSCMNTVCKGKPVDYKPKLDDWGSLKFNLIELMMKIQQAPFHILMLAQTQEAVMEDGGKKLTPMIGSYEFGKVVSSYFDSMVYTEVMNKSHKVGSSTTYSMSAITGSRRDIAIENDKDRSLIPFYTPVVIAAAMAAKKAVDIRSAKEVIEDLKGKKLSIPIAATKPAEVVNVPAAGESIEGWHSAIPKSSEQRIAAAASKVAEVVNAKSAVSPAAASAKSALEKLRALKK